MIQAYLHCSYSKASFSDEYAVKIISFNGNFEWCVVNREKLVMSDKSLGNGEQEGLVEITLQCHDNSRAIIEIDAAATLKFCVALKDIEFF